MPLVICLRCQGLMTKEMSMDLKDEIHNLEMKANGVKPMDSHFDCVGCGS